MAKLHRTELPYDPTPRAVAQASTLSFDALGVWVWARSLPDGAEVSSGDVEAAHRGLGADRAAKAVRALRAHGLWHTLTFRLPDGLLTSRVVIPPEPWTRERAAEVLGLDPAELVEGPSDRRHLRAVSAGHTDTRISESRSTDHRSTDHRSAESRSPGSDSSQNRRSTTPPTPRSAGGVADGCNQGHKRAVRGCCSRRDVAARQAAASSAADREAARARLAELRAPAGDDAAGIAAARAELAASAARRRAEP